MTKNSPQKDCKQALSTWQKLCKKTTGPGTAELMEINQLPFKPGTLALTIAAIVFVSLPVPVVLAEETEWDCDTTPGGKQDCGIVDKNPNPLERTPVVTKSKSPKLAGSSDKTAATLDWVPLSRLTDAQRARLPYYACGMYVEPPRPGINFRGNIDEAPIIAEANESNYNESELATLLGDVHIRQGYRQLTSQQATFDRQTNYGRYRGSVSFRDRGILLTGESGDLQIDTGRATLNNATYVMHASNARGEAGQVVHNEDGTLDLTDATYTTCSPYAVGWQLSGQSVNLDQEAGRGVARNAVVRIEGVPVLYSPWLSFPTDNRRKSGFLYPTFSQESDNGLDFQVPYYWNIAPDYDATITPRMMTKRGFMLESEFRYLTGSAQGELGLSGLAGKDALKEENPFYDKSRWLINYRHQSQLTSRWFADIDYAQTSDKNYLSDFSSGLNLSGSGPLNQRIGTRYEGGDEHHIWRASLNARKYQNISRTGDDPYNKLPQLTLTGSWQNENPLSLSYTADYTHFSRDDSWKYLYEEQVNGVKHSVYNDGYGIKRAHGQRLYLETGASYPMETTYGFLTPSFKVQHVQYQLSNLNRAETVDDLTRAYADSFTADDYTESPVTTVPVVSLDTGLYFDRLLELGSSSYTHTIEPRAKYLYSPYVKGQEMNPVFDTSSLGFSYHSLWRDSRFTGYDRLGDANQIALGFTSRLIEDNGFEKARFGIGQIAYLKSRRLWINPNAGTEANPGSGDNVTPDEVQRLSDEMTHRTSPLAAELVYNFNRITNLQQDITWNTNKGELDSYGLYYSYMPTNRKVMNVGYRFRNQADRYVKDENNQNIPDGSGNFLTTSGDYSQTDVSFALPVYRNWSALGRWQYDLTNRRNLEILSGVEYNSCCYQVRVMWRRWIDEDDTNIDHARSRSGIFLQFVLRGLGDLTGGSVKEYLSGIKGYARDEK